MAKKKDSVKQPSLKDQLAASRRINDNIAGRVREEEEEQEEEEEGIVPENMTVAELKAALDEAGVEYKSDDKKADLVQLYSDWLADQQGEEEEEEQE
jgi:hypothetical protein